MSFEFVWRLWRGSIATWTEGFNCRPVLLYSGRPFSSQWSIEHRHGVVREDEDTHLVSQVSSTKPRWSMEWQMSHPGCPHMPTKLWKFPANYLTWRYYNMWCWLHYLTSYCVTKCNDENIWEMLSINNVNYIYWAICLSK